MRSGTGWFGIPGRAGAFTQIHYVLDKKPICGATMRREMEFQFCAAGFSENYVECETCKRLGRTPTKGRA